MNTPNSSKPKPYQLKFEHRSQYLYAYVNGENDSAEISLSFWREIAAEYRKTKYTKILVDEDIRGCVSPEDMYRIGAEIPKLGFTSVRVAFFDRYVEHHEMNRFGILVATNRGLISRTFNDFSQAERWLLKG
jgi:hypothetical protein